MFGLDINVWAVLAATIAGMVIGAIWYSGKVFGPIFRAEVAKLGTKGGDLGKAVAISAATQLVTALVLATIFSYIGVEGPGQGTIIGLEFGLGLILPFAVKAAPFEGRSWTLVALNTGEHAVTLAAMGAILGAWR
jgi:hypothetical protein